VSRRDRIHVLTGHRDAESRRSGAHAADTDASHRPAEPADQSARDARRNARLFTLRRLVFRRAPRATPPPGGGRRVQLCVSVTRWLVNRARALPDIPTRLPLRVPFVFVAPFLGVRSFPPFPSAVGIKLPSIHSAMSNPSSTTRSQLAVCTPGTALGVGRGRATDAEDFGDAAPRRVQSRPSRSRRSGSVPPGRKRSCSTRS